MTKTKIRNGFTNNILADIRLSKAQSKLNQSSKIIQSGEVLDKKLGNPVKKILLDVVVLLAKDVFPQISN